MYEYTTIESIENNTFYEFAAKKRSRSAQYVFEKK